MNDERQAQVRARRHIYLRRASNGEFWISGVTFREFLEGELEPTNLLLLRHGYEDAARHAATGFDFISAQELSQSVRLVDVYEFGDFWWIDFRDFDSSRKLRRQELAELCYLAHTGEVFASPFFESLSNRYLYRGHDDGWLLRLFGAEEERTHSVLARAIATKLGGAIDESTLLEAGFWSGLADGVLLEVPSEAGYVTVRTIGTHEDMDVWMNDLESIMQSPITETFALRP